MNFVRYLLVSWDQNLMKTSKKPTHTISLDLISRLYKKSYADFVLYDLVRTDFCFFIRIFIAQNTRHSYLTIAVFIESNHQTNVLAS
jgi:hypothetical protein